VPVMVIVWLAMLVVPSPLPFTALDCKARVVLPFSMPAPRPAPNPTSSEPLPLPPPAMLPTEPVAVKLALVLENPLLCKVSV